MKKKNILITTLSIIIVIVVGGLIYLSFPPPTDVGRTDARIIAAISQAKTVMGYLKDDEGNYDNFSCEHNDMIPLCREINEGGKSMAVVVLDKIKDSENACIYAYLNYRSSKKQGFWRKTKDYWYCADSSGNAGATAIDPGSKGYCIEDESAVCPSVKY